VTIPDDNTQPLADAYEGWFQGVTAGGGAVFGGDVSAAFGSETLLPQMPNGYPPTSYTGVNAYGLKPTLTYPGGAVNGQITKYFSLKKYLTWWFSKILP
jgi:hypothetical protein